MMAKFLESKGLTHLWIKFKEYLANWKTTNFGSGSYDNKNEFIIGENCNLVVSNTYGGQSTGDFQLYLGPASDFMGVSSFVITKDHGIALFPCGRFGAQLQNSTTATRNIAYFPLTTDIDTFITIQLPPDEYKLLETFGQPSSSFPIFMIW